MEKGGIRMERSSGKITMLVLGTRLCSEGKLPRLISHFRQAAVFGFFAMALLALAFPARGQISFMNGSFEMTPLNSSSFELPSSSPASGPGALLPGWTVTNAPQDLACLVFPSGAP